MLWPAQTYITRRSSSWDRAAKGTGWRPMFRMPSLAECFTVLSWQEPMRGSGNLATDQASGCANCHSGSQFRPVNYTTRSIAAGAEVTLGRTKLTYSHEVRSFNDRLQSPSVYLGPMINDFAHGLFPGVPDSLPGNYTINVLAPSCPCAGSLSMTM